MDSLISEYLKSKELAWTKSSRRSEKHRLNAVKDLIDGDPDRLWNYVFKKYKPYSRVTVWTRVSCFYDWAIQEGRIQGPNPYKKFRQKNARVFKNVYTKSYPKLSYAEAERRLHSILDRDIREKCLELLLNGMRYTESFTRDADNYITGKGGKRRRVYGFKPSGVFRGTYGKLRRELGRIGLKPHDLRKLFATNLYRKGLDPMDVAKVLGWNSFETAKSYIAPRKDEELERLINGI